MTYAEYLEELICLLRETRQDFEDLEARMAQREEDNESIH